MSMKLYHGYRQHIFFQKSPRATTIIKKGKLHQLGMIPCG